MRVYERGPRRLGAILTGIVFLSGACRGPVPPPLDPLPATKQEVGQAMVSVHAHARWPDRNFDGAKFITLENAILILMRDKGRPGAGLRARRAVAKLLSHAYGRRDIEIAVERLLAKYGVGFAGVKGLVKTVAEGATPPIALPPPEDRMRDLEVLIVDLEPLVELAPDCKAKAPRYSGGVKKPPPVAWDYDQYIPRRKEDVARSLDPQSWAEASEYFYHAYFVDCPPCCPSPGTCPHTQKPSSDPNAGDPTEGPKKPIAKPYGPTAFFETFCIGSHCPRCEEHDKECLAQFKNILCTDTKYEPPITFSFLASCSDRYVVGYELAEYLSGELNGSEGQVIKADGGTLSVRDVTDAEKQQNNLVGPDWSLVHVDKSLTFQGSVGQGSGNVLLTLQDELAGQIVNQACHEVPGECWLLPGSP